MLGKALLKLAQQQPASVHTQLETLMSMLGDLAESPKTEVFVSYPRCEHLSVMEEGVLLLDFLLFFFIPHLCPFLST